ncbi:type II toxin-antitoxin system PemK/MazF family toxin [Intrasporangium sp.]|uniref:type II toxin-antitoxin system PemK/MazF family toxin n=1 Tax=Intrasporangium sp. TaxID=1925024 RepID=UPI003464D62D
MVLADAPARREVWLVALGAGRTGEPGNTRHAVVVSADELSSGVPEELIVVVPLSSSLAPSPLRVDIATGAGGDQPSRAVCRAIRAVSCSRFVRRIGSIDQASTEQIEVALALILGLDRRPGVGSGSCSGTSARRHATHHPLQPGIADARVQSCTRVELHGHRRRRSPRGVMWKPACESACTRG